MIRRQILVPVNPDRLWTALTDPTELAGWFGGTVDWELREGAGLTYRGADGARREGRVESVRPGRHLRFRWWPAPPGGSTPTGTGAGRTGPGIAGATVGAEDDPVDPTATEVTYVLVPEGDSTRLTVQERPLEEPTVPRGDRAPSASASAASWSTAAPGWTQWDERLALGWIRLDPGVRAPVGARS